jgi:hypothetical protein
MAAGDSHLGNTRATERHLGDTRTAAVLVSTTTSKGRCELVCGGAQAGMPTLGRQLSDRSPGVTTARDRPFFGPDRHLGDTQTTDGLEKVVVAVFGAAEPPPDAQKAGRSGAGLRGTVLAAVW